jgi:hypothetical protein
MARNALGQNRFVRISEGAWIRWKLRGGSGPRVPDRCRQGDCFSGGMRRGPTWSVELSRES